jgi:hypothetical protein
VFNCAAATDVIPIAATITALAKNPKGFFMNHQLLFIVSDVPTLPGFWWNVELKGMLSFLLSSILRWLSTMYLSSSWLTFNTAQSVNDPFCLTSSFSCFWRFSMICERSSWFIARQPSISECLQVLIVRFHFLPLLYPLFTNCSQHHFLENVRHFYTSYRAKKMIFIDLFLFSVYNIFKIVMFGNGVL